MRILIANRGEIARRVQRTAVALGHETVAVYADPDRDAPFVREATLAFHLGPARLDASYLNIERLLEGAARTNATAVHPGYGFLSESPEFAKAVEGAGLIWIGPHADAIERMGSKIEARAIAEAARIPTIPGFDASQDPADLAAAAERIGFPVLVKAAAGGGGKGIRIAHNGSEFAAALAEAKAEAKRSFGDEAVIVERYVEHARHIEVQVVGDQHGNVIDLGTRECSVQRRYQKLLEEAPAPNLIDTTREGLSASARALALAMKYDSVGTVEFVVDADTGDYYFLEMNTRLQVEHTVTEAVTGLDLVALQFACAEGELLTLRQEDVRCEGHAFEVRINAEDSSADFAPQSGIVSALRVPSGVRWDSGVELGSAVTPHYDPMVSKLVAHGADRDTARRKLASALDALIIGGLPTNVGFHRWLVEQPELVEGRVTTRFLDMHPPPAATEEDLSSVRGLVAACWSAARNGTARGGPWSVLHSFRVTPHQRACSVAIEDRSGRAFDVADTQQVDWRDGDPVVTLAGVARPVAAVVDVAARRVVLNWHGENYTFRVLTPEERWASSGTSNPDPAGDVTRSPFPAVVAEILVSAGDSVAAGDVVIVIEAMKMLHSLEAPGPALVERVHVGVGESVESNQALVSYAEADAQEAREGE